MKYLIFCFLITVITIPSSLSAQNNGDNKGYSITGTVVNGSNNTILTGANIVSSRKKGTKTSELGEFTIFVTPNDTLKISYVGYKTVAYVCPEKETGVYLIKFKMYQDSVSLQEVEIFPYPTYKEFREAFISLDKQDEKVEIEGVKTYQDKITTHDRPTVFSPISYVYDRLFDKQAKLKRKLDRRKETIKEGTQVDE